MQVIERILHMLRVKDCRHVCLFSCRFPLMSCNAHVLTRRTMNQNIRFQIPSDDRLCFIF